MCTLWRQTAAARRAIFAAERGLPPGFHAEQISTCIHASRRQLDARLF